MVVGETGSTRNGFIQGRSADFHPGAAFVPGQVVRLLLPRRLSGAVRKGLNCFKKAVAKRSFISDDFCIYFECVHFYINVASCRLAIIARQATNKIHESNVFNDYPYPVAYAEGGLGVSNTPIQWITGHSNIGGTVGYAVLCYMSRAYISRTELGFNFGIQRTDNQPRWRS